MDNKQRQKLEENADWSGGAPKFAVLPPVIVGGAPGTVACLRCNVVVYVDDLLEEERSPGIFAAAVKGIYCPNCNQRLFDALSWAAYQASKFGKPLSPAPRRSGRKNA